MWKGRVLNQGTQSVADFLIEFRILAAEIGWGSNALRGIFFNSPSEQIKVQLAFHDEPSSFEELASLAIRVNNRIREQKRERDPNSHKPLRKHSSRKIYPTWLPQYSRPVDNLPATNTEATEPMQIRTDPLNA